MAKINKAKMLARSIGAVKLSASTKASFSMSPAIQVARPQ